MGNFKAKLPVNTEFRSVLWAAESKCFRRIYSHGHMAVRLEVKLDDQTVMTAKQIKELQKRNALLEEENLILKKALAIFTPH